MQFTSGMDALADDPYKLGFNELAYIDPVDVGEDGERFVHLGIELRADVFAFETHARTIEYGAWKWLYLGFGDDIIDIKQR